MSRVGHLVLLAAIVAAAAAGGARSDSAATEARWPTFHLDAGRTGFNPLETTVGPDNVIFLGPKWVGFDMGGLVDSSSPAVTKSRVFITDSWFGRLWAFSTSCGFGGSFCRPLWSGRMAAEHSSESSPAVANGFVYVGVGDTFEAYRAGGCGQARCSPLWIGFGEGSQAAILSSPAVANGVVYVGENSAKVIAFAAAGCGKTVCDPLWQGLTDGSIVSSSPAIVDGILYIGSEDAAYPDDQAGRLYAFSLSGG